MTTQDIHSILQRLFTIPNVIDGKVRIDFYRGDEFLGDIYYIPTIVKGQRKPIQQTVYVIDSSDMRGVMEYINNLIPLKEEDMELIHKTINVYCQDIIQRQGGKLSNTILQ